LVTFGYIWINVKMNDGSSILPWPNKINARVRANEKGERPPPLGGGGSGGGGGGREERKKKRKKERKKKE